MKKRYERLEIYREECDLQRPDEPGPETYDCEVWPMLRLWTGGDGLEEAEPPTQGLSDRGLRLCLSALTRWQGEHPGKRVELGPDGKYVVVDVMPGAAPDGKE